MRWWAAASVILICLPAGPAAATDRLATSAACVKNAATQGLERALVLPADATPEQRREALQRSERNHRLRVDRTRACITADEAGHLGRVSLFLDVLGERCGVRRAAALSSPRDPIWGDTDLLNGAAIASIGNDKKIDGPFFTAQVPLRAALRNRNAATEAALCAEFWASYGPQGAVLKGLLQR